MHSLLISLINTLHLFCGYDYISQFLSFMRPYLGCLIFCTERSTILKHLTGHGGQGSSETGSVEVEENVSWILL